jgi:phospholipid/cholesterol/gamma-HCH transport system substrate-binding protein
VSSSTAEAVVGAAVLATAAGFVLYAAEVREPRAGPNTYPLTANFRSVEGVAVGTDVRLAGIRVGSVTDMELDPESYRVQASFAVRGDLAIPEDSSVSIASEGFLGGAFLEIDPGTSEFMLAAGDEILDTRSTTASLIDMLMRFGSRP